MTAREFFSRSRSVDNKPVAQQAAAWLIRRRESATPEEERAFQQWLAKTPENGRAFAMVEKTWMTLNEARVEGQAARLDVELQRLHERRVRRRRRRIIATAGLAAAAAVVFALFAPASRLAITPSTVVVRPDQQALPDGSVVELKAGAEIAISFSPQTRHVRLRQGEALFRVKKDPARPFVVTAGAVSVHAVGTAFTVSHGAKEIAVVVTEGRVAVERAVNSTAVATSIGTGPTLMAAGDRLVVPADLPATAPLAVTSLTAQQLAAGLAWRGKRVEFNGTPVTEAVTLFNAKNRLQLSTGDATIARLKITGVFWSDDPEGFVRLLETGMNARSERTGNEIVLFSR